MKLFSILLILAVSASVKLAETSLPATQWHRQIPAFSTKKCNSKARTYNIFQVAPELQNACALKEYTEGNVITSIKCGDSKFPWCQKSTSSCVKVKPEGTDFYPRYSYPLAEGIESSSTDNVKKCAPSENLIPAPKACAKENHVPNFQAKIPAFWNGCGVGTDISKKIDQDLAAEGVDLNDAPVPATVTDAKQYYCAHPDRKYCNS